MEQIGIGQLQKKTSIFTSLSHAIEIIDKRKNKPLAVIYPISHDGMIEKLAGKYKNRIQSPVTDLTKAKEKAVTAAVKEKYGSSS